jgi:hypothetical protein
MKTSGPGRLERKCIGPEMENGVAKSKFPLSKSKGHALSVEEYYIKEGD